MTCTMKFRSLFFDFKPLEYSCVGETLTLPLSAWKLEKSETKSWVLNDELTFLLEEVRRKNIVPSFLFFPRPTRFTNDFVLAIRCKDNFCNQSHSTEKLCSANFSVWGSNGVYELSAAKVVQSFHLKSFPKWIKTLIPFSFPMWMIVELQ